MMKKYKFLYDPQSGAYMGLVRGDFPDNSTHVQPHFSWGHKTCWDFNGRWVLVREEKFFESLSRADVLRDYDREVGRYAYKIRGVVIREVGKGVSETVLGVSGKIDSFEGVMLEEFGQLYARQAQRDAVLFERMGEVLKRLEGVESIQGEVLWHVRAFERFKATCGRYIQRIKASLKL